MTGSTNAVVLDVQCGANNPIGKACNRSWYTQDLYLDYALEEMDEEHIVLLILQIFCKMK